MQKDSKHET